MKAANLNTLGVFEQRSATKDGFGQEVDTWAPLASAPMEIKTADLRNLERMRAAGVVSSSLSHMVTCRYNPLLRPFVKTGKYRITATDDVGVRVFNIHYGYDVEERHEWMVFAVSEGTLDGQ